ncbi:phosphoenolpyruvate synthase [Paraflavisolibacter sp. H34]|uniref:phosphoenolpyruvate synthase n=1 Tax=Huijunlia imazamoxiresistens TaxID=3127457 RepID=UPI003018D3AC
MNPTSYTRKLAEVGIYDIDVVGGKNASLGEMLQHLSQLGINIPDGFVVTVDAYQAFILHNGLEARIRGLIQGIVNDDLDSLRSAGAQVRQLILDGVFPDELMLQIEEAYSALCRQYGMEAVDVAVRSSATAEDLPDASFAGQQETYLNIKGPGAVLSAIRHCFASLFTDRAISYRESFGYDHFVIGLSVCVQKMVRSDKAVSGVAFSLDTESGFKDAVIINASYGLGEMIVQGAISPDEFIVFKPTLSAGYPSIIEKKMGVKNRKMIYGDSPHERVKIVDTSKAEQDAFCLSNEQVIQLAQWVMDIEAYYSMIKERWCPMDIEWAVDGLTGLLYIVQARPETVHSRKEARSQTLYHIEEKNRAEKVLLTGIAVGDKIAAGPVVILGEFAKDSVEHIEFEEGSVLVTNMTDPDWEPIMKKASAIVTNKGGRTCHAAIVARELGIPAVVGCGNATELLSEGREITVSCAEGESGIIYDGVLEFSEQRIHFNELPQTRTPILLNVASPDMAFHFSHFPQRGVGLAREEFIINNYIKVHPLALLQHESLGDAQLSAQIAQLTKGFKDGETYFVEKLSYGVAKIASAFYPNKVIVRFSDFKSNEYYNLLGGKYFEPHEENPMIGWRGASRYYSDKYKEAFGMECRAIKKVREELGLSNVVMMIPFCRTVAELHKVYAVMAEYGLVRGRDGLEVYLMAEIPSNVIMADKFAQHIDGFSIGSNDLTQLVLGLDRDSALVAHLYDERNEAVKAMIRTVIAAAKKAKVKVGICGQGPSDFPDFAQFLVELNIDSISVTPDSFFKTVNAVHYIETKMENNAAVGPKLEVR